MQLRPRQKIAVKKSIDALIKEKSTLLRAGAGTGKTVMFSAVANEMIKMNPKMRILVVVHLKKVNRQNLETFKRYCNRPVSYFSGAIKMLSGQVIFATVQTVAMYYKKFPKFDMVIVDEGHHARALSYDEIIDDMKAKNKSLYVFLLTATTERGDEKTLHKHASNVADIITTAEMVESNNLVGFKANSIKTSFPLVESDFYKQKVDEFGHVQIVKRTNSEMLTIQGKLKNGTLLHKFMHLKNIQDLIFNNWKEHSKGMKSIFFCRNVSQCEKVQQMFLDRGVGCSIIHSKQGDDENKRNLDKFESFEKGCNDVCINVEIFTEGYDFQPIYYMAVLKRWNVKKDWIQAIGRCTRSVDPIQFPNVFKTHGYIDDYCSNVELHGDLEYETTLEKYKGYELKEINIVNPTDEQKILPDNSLSVDRSIEESDFENSINNFYQKDGFRWEKFEGDDFAIWGAVGYNSSCFIFDGKCIMWNKKDDEFSTISKMEYVQMLKLANEFMEKLEHTNESIYIDKCKNPINKIQINLLLGKTSINSCTEYRASILIDWFYNKERFLNEQKI